MAKNLFNKMEEYKINKENEVKIEDRNLFRVENGKIVQNNAPKHAKELVAMNSKLISKESDVEKHNVSKINNSKSL